MKIRQRRDPSDEPPPEHVKRQLIRQRPFVRDACRREQLQRQLVRLL